MLVLSRLINEEIVIGQDIHVTVLAAKGKKVRLGISVPVNRREVLAARDAERQEAASAGGTM